MHTLKSFLEQMMPRYGEYFANIVADAGYESVENYAYLREKWLKSYIKPSNYETSKRKSSAEGMFSKLKDGLKYDRFRHRGLKSVVSDITLMAIGINLNKLHSKLIKNQTDVIEYKKVA